MRIGLIPYLAWIQILSRGLLTHHALAWGGGHCSFNALKSHLLELRRREMVVLGLPTQSRGSRDSQVQNSLNH